jgi:hypothetical protein
LYSATSRHAALIGTLSERGRAVDHKIEKFVHVFFLEKPSIFVITKIRGNRSQTRGSRRPRLKKLNKRLVARFHRRFLGGFEVFDALIEGLGLSVQLAMKEGPKLRHVLVVL